MIWDEYQSIIWRLISPHCNHQDAGCGHAFHDDA